MSTRARRSAARWFPWVGIGAVLLVVGGFSVQRLRHPPKHQQLVVVTTTSTTVNPALDFFSDPLAGTDLSASETAAPASGGTLARGGVVQWIITVRTVGQSLARGVGLIDVPGQGSNWLPTWTLAAGTVTTSLGGVTKGNAPGDTAVSVDVGALPAGATATVTFRAAATGASGPQGLVPIVADQAVFGADNAPTIRSTGPPLVGTCASVLSQNVPGATCLNLSG